MKSLYADFMVAVLGQSQPVSPVFRWKPFIDPIDLHGSFWLGGWTLLVPLAFGIAIIYKAVRVNVPGPDPSAGVGAPPPPTWWSLYWRQAVILTVQIIVSMIALAVAAYLLVEVYVGWIAEKAA